IHDTQGIRLHEFNSRSTERSFGDPPLAISLHGRARKSGGPLRKIARFGSELIYIGRCSIDVDAYMSYVTHSSAPVKPARAHITRTPPSPRPLLPLHTSGLRRARKRAKPRPQYSLESQPAGNCAEWHLRRTIACRRPE